MKLTELELDALRELVNIGVGKASGLLSDMLETRIKLFIPDMKILNKKELEEAYSGFADRKLSTINMNFNGVFNGSILLVFPPESAESIVNILTEEEDEGTNFDSAKSGALTEVGNIVLNGIIGSISNILKERLNYTVPTYFEETIRNIVTYKTENLDDTIMTLLAHTHFEIFKFSISGDILLFMELGSFQALVEKLDQMIEGNS